MADPAAKELAAAMALPLPEKAAHKLWKARLAAYEEMAAACEKATPDDCGAVKEFAGMLPKAVQDANAAAQEKALDAATAFLHKTDEATAGRLAPVLAPAVVKSCLNGRPRAVEKSTEVFMLLAELEASAACVDALIGACKHKVPKVVLAAATALLALVSSFGAPTVDPKPILKGIAPLFDAKDAKARDVGKQLVVELARWVGTGAVTSLLLDQMRDTMRKEMEEAMRDVASAAKPKPERLTRKKQAALAATEAGAPATPGAAAAGASSPGGPAAAAGASSPAAGGVPDMDTYDLCDPVAILRELKDDVFWTPVVAAKWSERRDALLHLKQLASAPRLASGDYGDVSRALAKIIKSDSNVVCVTESFLSAAALGRGLRKDFSASARSFVPLALMKLKDKSGAVVNAALEALGVFAAFCIQLSDVADDIIDGHLKTCKVAKAKASALNWLSESATKAMGSKKSTKDLAKFVKDLAPTLEALATDADATVRDAAIGCAASFARVGAECKSITDRFAANLDDAKRKKYDALVEGGAPTAPAVPARPSTAAARSGSDHASAATAGSLPARPGTAGATRPGTARPGTARPRTAGPKTSAAKDDSDASAPLMTVEVAEERVSVLLGGSNFEKLIAQDWKERVAAVTAIRESIEAKAAGAGDPPDEDSSAFDASYTEALIIFMCARPGIKQETNFQVVRGSVEALASVVKTSAFVTKALAHHVIGACVAKLSDTKLKGAVTELFLALSECTSPTFVIKQSFQASGADIAKKNVKLYSELVRYVKASMFAFGASAVPSAASVDLKASLALCKTALLDATSPLVKTAVMETLGFANTMLGTTGTLAILSAAPGGEIKGALMANVETECNKNPPGEQPHVPERKVRAAKIAAKKRAAAGGGAEDDADAGVLGLNGADGPKVDITARITPKLLKDLSSTNWKERAAALQSVEGILGETRLPGCGGATVAPGAMSDILSALKARLSDNNKNLVASALSVLGSFGSAIGSPFMKHVNGLLSGVLNAFNDQKKATREAAAKCLTSWIAHNPHAVLDKLLHGTHAVRDYVHDAKSSPDGKLDVLILFKAYASESSARPYLKKIAAVAAGDKSAAVRAAGADLHGAVEDAADAAPAAPTSVAGAASSSEDAAPHAPSSPAHAGAAEHMASPRTSAVAHPASAAAHAEAEADDDEEAVFRGASNAAAAREERLRRVPRRLKFDDGPRTSDQYDAVYEGLAPSLRPDVLEQLRNADFKRMCGGVDAVIAAAQLSPGSAAQATTVDLLFRWISLKLCEMNTTVTLKVLELAEVLVASVGSNLTDQDLALLLPTVVEKRGHNQDRIRQLHRELLQRMCAVLPVSKVTAYVLDGLKSKNSRTRIECADDVAMLADEAFAIGAKTPLDHDGAATFLDHTALAGSSIGEVLALSFEGTKKTTQSLVLLVGERDASLRGSVMSAIAALYKCVGADVIWKYVGHIPDAHRGLLVDKIKWVDKQLEKSGLPKAGSLLQGPGGKEKEKEKEKERPSTSGGRVSTGGGARASPMRQSAPALSARAGAAEPQSPVPRPVAPEEGMAPVTPYKVPPAALPPPMEAEVAEQWRRGCAAAADQSESASVEGMKLLCTLLAHASGGRLTDAGVAAVVAGANAAADGLADNADVALGRAAAGGSIRGAKYAVNTLMMLFNHPQCAREVSEPVLRTVMANLLVRLLDDRLPRIAEGPQLLKALNILMLRVLESSDRTKAFGVLLYLLRVPPERLSVRVDEHGGQLDDAEAQTRKFLELVVKCLIKLTKALGDSMAIVNVDELMQAIHGFFAGLGVDELRRRGSTDDKPLRMVKTVLHELCKILGYQVRNHLRLIPTTERPTPIILAYIDLNLSSLAGAGHANAVDPSAPAVATAAPPQTSGGLAAGSAGPSPARPRPATADAAPGSSGGASPQDLKQQLASIFKQIGDKATTAAGLEALYRFTKMHPSVDIHPHLAKTSEAFRAYIHRGLTKCASADLDKEKENAGKLVGGHPVGPMGGGGGPAPTPATKAVEQVEAMSRRFRDFRQQMAVPAAPPPTAPSASTAAGSNLEDIKRRFESIQAKAQTIHASIADESVPSGDASGAPSNLASLRARLDSLKK